MPVNIRLKRVYEPAAGTDGTRILVDRLWPRGISKAKAGIDLWLKDLSPSDDLRKRFHARPEQWQVFCAAYAAELAGDGPQAALSTLRDKEKNGPVTLLYAAKDEQHNNAAALKAWLAQHGG
ncbi:DUF488 domain-containing protein [Rhizobium subbaraonis]|nr:DUF488 domain-containing protein [Rhizobium subbaraonis]